MNRYFLTVFFLATLCSLAFSAEKSGLPEIKERLDIRDNLDPLVFVVPKGWTDTGGVNEKYEYSFMSGKRAEPSFFEVYFRRLNIPDQGAEKWAQDERRAHLGLKALKASTPQALLIGRRKWFWVESTWIAGNDIDPKAKVLIVEQYFSKDKGSNTIVEVAVLCQQEKFKENLMSEVTIFLKSIRCGKDTRQNTPQEVPVKGRSDKLLWVK